MTHQKMPPNPSMLGTLKKISREHKKKLLATLSLVFGENILILTYPLVGSFAVNAVIQGNVISALIYALMVLIIWVTGSARRAVDTRVFTRIYSMLVVPVILKQRINNMDTSTTTARVALSREFIHFFENNLPTLITSFCSIIGSVTMLLVIEFWSGITALVIMAIFCLCLPKYTLVNDRLYLRLNNRLEDEVNQIELAKNTRLVKHYRLVERLRVLISNREAMSFLIIGITLCILFSITLTLLTIHPNQNAGHIYAVITYLWTFAFSLNEVPSLVEEFSKLKDIGKRIHIN